MTAEGESSPHEPQPPATAAAPPPGVIEARLVEKGPPRRRAAMADAGRPHGMISGALNHRGAVLAVILLATGALGIPLLWISPRFSTAERIVWTVVATLYTAALFAILIAVLYWAYGRIVV